MKNKIILACLAIALLEGFAGLGIEIYAIRISATYIGSSTSITGVILAMVLLAIAAGYWYGGRLSDKAHTPKDALLKAGRVLALSAVSHAIACIAQLPLLDVMTRQIENPIISAVGVGLLFAGGLAFGSMAIPLITQFLTLQYKNSGHVDAGKNAGMMVAVTTVGSVLGSTLTPIILLPYIGLMTSLTLFVACLAISSAMCTVLANKVGSSKAMLHTTKSKPNSKRDNGLINYILALAALLGTVSFIAVNKIDTGIQTATTAWFVDYLEFENATAATISDYPERSVSSCWLYNSKQNCSWYGFQTLTNIEATQSKKLVFLGGAGMAIPSELAYSDPTTDITVIDIDKDLPPIVEKYFLGEPIAKNILFVGDDARGYLNRRDDIHYDFMFIDAFHGSYVAGNLYTIEALTKFKKASTYLMANVIGTREKDHGYTQTLLKNWYEVFGDSGYIISHIESGDIAAQEGFPENLLLCNFKCEGGKQIASLDYFDKNHQTHTDDIPRLDRYYYRSI